MPWRFLLLLLLFPAVDAHSENRLDLQGSIGATKSFLDEPFAAVVGGSVLIHALPRFAIGPEYLYTRVDGFRIRSLSATGIVTFSPWGVRATPYLTGSIGVVHDRDTRINYTAKELNASAGGGVRIRFMSGAFIAPEIRFGSYSLPTTAVHVGYSF